MQVANDGKRKLFFRGESKTLVHDRLVPSLSEFDFLTKRMSHDNVLARLTNPNQPDSKVLKPVLEPIDTTTEEKEEDLSTDVAKNDISLLSKKHWMPDQTCKVCYDCEAPFTLFRRRHHCRICGQVFCNGCSAQNIDGSLYNIQGSVRVCNYCFDQQLWRIRDSARSVTATTPPESPLDALPGWSDSSDAPSHPPPPPPAGEKEPHGNEEGSEEKDESLNINLNSVILGSYRLPGNKKVQSGPRIAKTPMLTLVRQVSSAEGKCNRSKLERLADAHLKYVLIRLCQEQGVDQARWLDLILKLTRTAVQKVRASARRGDNMDLRNYVKIKTISGGHITDSRFINGVLFRKNVTNRKMRKKIRDARILLLSCPIQFKGEHETQSGNRMSSLMTLIDQEKAHLANVVKKITRLGPDVVVVEKTVSHIAQEQLLEAGISLVLNVRPSIMSRLARSTGGHILRSPDYVENCLLKPDQLLGACKDFEIRVFKEEKGKKSTLMMFESSRTNRHGTIFLRGASKEVLRKVKSVLRTAVLVANNLKLETRFLLDECAMYPEDTYRKLMEKYESPSDSLPPSLPGIPEGKPSISKKSEEAILISMSPGIEVNLSDKYFARRAKQAYNALGPLVLSISYGKFCRLTHNWQCEAPREEGRIFYSMADMTLGRFLEEMCFDMEKRCANSKCRRNVLYHNRYYTHSQGRVHFTVKLLEPNTARALYDGLAAASKGSGSKSTSVSAGATMEKTSNHLSVGYGETVSPEGKKMRTTSPRDSAVSTTLDMEESGHITPRSSAATFGLGVGEASQILVCSFCKECDNRGPVTVLSEDSYNLSIGKFLDLTFHNHKLRCSAGNCSHSIHKSYVRQFVKGNMIAQFQYDPIRPFSISYQQKLSYDPNKLSHMLKSEIQRVIRTALALTGAFAKRIEGIKRSLGDSLRSPDNRSNPNTPKPTADAAISEPVVDEGSGHGADSEDSVEALPAPRLSQEARMSTIDARTKGFFNTLPTVSEALLTAVLKFEKQIAETRQTFISEFDRLSALSPPTSNGGHSRISFEIARFLRAMFDRRVEWNSRLGRLKKPLGHYVATQSAAQNAAEVATNLDVPGTRGLKSQSESVSVPTSPKYPNLKAKSEDSKFGVPKVIRKPHAYSEREKKSNPKLRGTGFTAVSGPTSPVKEERHRPMSVSPRSVLRAGVRRNVSEKTDASYVQTQRRAQRLCNPVSVKEIAEYDPMLTTWDLEFFASGTLVSNVDVCGNDVSEVDSGNGVSNNLEQEALHPCRVHLNLPSLVNNFSIPVYEDETSSIISYALASRAHAAVIQSPPPSPPLPGNRRSNPAPSLSKQNSLSRSRFSGVLDSKGENPPPPCSSIEEKEGGGEGKRAGMKKGVEGDLDVFSPSWYLTDPDSLQNVLMNEAEKPVEITFSDMMKNGLFVPHPTTVTKFTCKVFFPRKFHALRHVFCGGEASFISSLSRCKGWHATGGKSNATFAQSRYERYVIKYVSQKEFKMFTELAPAYFRFMGKACFRGLPTVLSKILGCYQVWWKRQNEKLANRYAFVMPNVFYGRSVTHIFDLKGSVRNRYVRSKPGEKRVLLDENFLEYTRGFPIPIEEPAKDALRHAVRNDSKFLCDMEIVDYSILVGLHEKSRSMSVGIIDYVRQYTWERKIESGMKSMGMITGRASPTVISPGNYKVRFQLATERYFMMAPVQTSRAGLPALPPPVTAIALQNLISIALNPKDTKNAKPSPEIMRVVTHRAIAEMVQDSPIRGEAAVCSLLGVASRMETKKPSYEDAVTSLDAVMKALPMPGGDVGSSRIGALARVTREALNVAASIGVHPQRQRKSSAVETTIAALKKSGFS